MKKIYLLLFALLSAISICAQNQKPGPDLTGTWEFSKKGSSDDLGTGSTWVIKQLGQRITIEKYFTKKGRTDHVIELNSDGSREINAVPGFQSTRRVDVRSKTTWEKKKLVRSYAPVTDPPIAIGGQTTEKFWLSEDGTALYFERREHSDLFGTSFPQRLTFTKKM